MLLAGGTAFTSTQVVLLFRILSGIFRTTTVPEASSSRAGLFITL